MLVGRITMSDAGNSLSSKWVNTVYDNEKAKSLELQIDRLKEYIVKLNKQTDIYKSDSLQDLSKLEFHTVDLYDQVMMFKTETLKQAWDMLYEDDAEYDFESIIEAIHLELNMRGEGDYVAV